MKTIIRNNIHIEDSYNIWDTKDMRIILEEECHTRFGFYAPEIILNRSYYSMYVEWWLHNILYYITKPFCSIDFIKKINLRCKDVDLSEWR